MYSLHVLIKIMKLTQFAIADKKLLCVCFLQNSLGNLSGRCHNPGRRKGHDLSLTCSHDTCGGNRHDGDVLGSVRRMQVSPDCTQGCTTAVSTTASFLFGHHPHPSPWFHWARNGKHSCGIVRRWGGRRRGVRKRGRIGLLWTQLLLCLVQEHGVLDLDSGE